MTIRMTKANVEAVLRYLPYFENTANKFYQVKGGGYSYSPRVQEFLQSLEENGFIQPFNWTAWEGQARLFLNDAQALSEADLRTLIMLFTTLVKKEAVSEGHLMLVMCSGQLSTILQRLREIYRQKWGAAV